MPLRNQAVGVITNFNLTNLDRSIREPKRLYVRRVKSQCEFVSFSANSFPELFKEVTAMYPLITPVIIDNGDVTFDICRCDLQHCSDIIED